jgi:hypothetical protein
MSASMDKALAARLRELNRDPRFIEFATMANYSAIRPTELKWPDLVDASKDHYRVGARRLLEDVARLLDEGLLEGN